MFDHGLPIGWKQIAAAIGIPAAAGLLVYTFCKREREAGSEILRSDFLKSKVPVPEDKIGAVIGRSGTVVREIEQSSGARVRVIAPPLNPLDKNSAGAVEEEKDGVVVIQGRRYNVLAAEIAVRKVIAQTPPVLTENVYVPKASIGFIIGKKGASIRELSHISGAKVVIGRSGNEMEVLTIKGRPQAIDAAKMWLEKKVKESEELRNKWNRSKEPRQRSRLTTECDDTALNATDSDVSTLLGTSPTVRTAAHSMDNKDASAENGRQAEAWGSGEDMWE